LIAKTISQILSKTNENDRKGGHKKAAWLAAGGSKGKNQTMC
jgi:hypothetical protein